MKKLFVFPLMFLTMIAFSQNWTPEEKEIIQRVETGWSSWEDAVNDKDYSIWLNAVDPTDDWCCWFTTDPYLWSTEDTKKNFEFLIKDIRQFKWITIKPLEIQVHDNVAFIWFYASSAIENTKGITNTSVEKRFEVYRRFEGKWRWSAGMVDAEPVNNILESFASIGYGQEKPSRIQLGLFSSHPYNFEYVNGKVKEINYQAFHITDVDGKVVKGKPTTFDEAYNVALRQPWSYYYNELGQMVKMSIKSDDGHRWTGVVHYDNDRIENIYWLKEDTLWRNHDIVYMDDGTIEKRRVRIRDNKVTGKTILVLDKGGNVLKETDQGDDGIVGNTFEISRNQDGTIKTQKLILGDGTLQNYFVDYKYNEKGLFESMLMKVLGKEEVNQPAGRIEYKYDEHGNWIKWINRGWIMIERTIEYYD